MIPTAMIFESWLPITITGVKPFYYISSYGRVCSYARHNPIIMTPVMDEHGYLRVMLRMEGRDKGRYFMVHRLVLETFNPIPGYENLQVNHKNTIKTCNFYWNLEWMTCQENIIHAVNNRVFGQLGENNTNCIASDIQIENICKLWSDTNMTANQIAIEVGTTESVVRNVVAGASRKYISDKYNLQRRQSHPLTEEQIHMVCKIFEDNTNINPKDLFPYVCECLNIEMNSKVYSSLNHIYRHHTFNHISNQYSF